jgi:hypothetical protein
MPTPLSSHWSLEQLCATSHGPNPLTACSRYGVRVELDELQANGEHLAQNLLDRLFEQFGWRVSSCYRSPPVNKAVNGDSNSAHLAFLACDGSPADGRGSFADVIRSLAAEPPACLDRVIFEVRGSTRWLHVQALAPGAASQRLAWIYSPQAGAYLLKTAEQLAAIAS